MLRFKHIGLNFSRARRALTALPSFIRDYYILSAQAKKHGKHFPFGKTFPCLEDKKVNSGEAKGHYFHQDILVARRIYETMPQKHVDIGSRVDGFVAHVAVFREIEVFDIRKLKPTTKNIIFVQRDLMKAGDPELSLYCDSLSCLHAIEHFGLGRYGDDIDYTGHEKALSVMKNMVRPGGRFFLSTPIGPQRIEFNAHRVFSCDHILNLIGDTFRLDRFSYVDDHGDLYENVPVSQASLEQSFNCTFGCGIFEFVKHETCDKAEAPGADVIFPG